MSGVRQVLLVEDEPLITLMYEDAFLDTEFRLIAALDCNKDALVALSDQNVDLVIVDYNLADGPCLPLVAKLKELSIPFLIASGFEDPPAEQVVGVPWLSKPFSGEKLLRALRKVAP